MKPISIRTNALTCSRCPAFFLEFADVIRPALKKTRVYVTGGFRTASGMIRAIQSGSTDGIGLGRPVCEEPDLPNKLISGKVSGALNTLFDPDDFGTTLAAAGFHIKQMSSGYKPFSTVDKESVERFMSVLSAFGKETEENVQKGTVVAGIPQKWIEELKA